MLETSSSLRWHEDAPERHASDRLRRLLDRAVAASSNGIIITDAKLPDNPIVYVNPAFERISGYPAEEVRGRNCRFLQRGERDQAALEELRTAIRQERESRVILKNFRKDGTLFWNELYISPVFDEQGALTNFVGVQSDITERNRIQETLRESEERFRATFEQAAVGVSQVGIDGRWLRVNGKLCEILGYSREELLERSFQEVTLPEDLDRHFVQMERLLRGDIPTYSLEKRYVRKDGSSVWVNVTVSLVRDAAGEPKYLVAVIEDISERKKTEEERDLLLVREQLARAEAETARTRLSILAAAGPALSSSLDYLGTLRTAARLVVPDLADWCLLDAIGEDGEVQQLVGAHADPEKEELLTRIKEYRGFGDDDPGSTARVLRTGQAVLIPEVPERFHEGAGLSGEYLDIYLQLAPHSIISVPLSARGRTVGAMTMVSSDPDRRYEEQDLAFAEDLAYRCALAADNARLYSERNEISRVLQRSLLPPDLPEVPGVQVGAEYLPVGEANEVGGDFYDLIDVPNDGYICTIGDVRGKGAGAAAVTALARYTIRAVTMRTDSPAEILTALNQAMLLQLPEERFCTVACVRLEPVDGSPGVGVKVSRAGHPPPLVLHEDGSIDEIGCPGRTLGVFEDPELVEASLRLMPGDTLVLYTDGITEARSPGGEFFGEERLRRMLLSSSGRSASEIAWKIKYAALEFQENDPRDDLAVLVLCVS